MKKINLTFLVIFSVVVLIIVFLSTSNYLNPSKQASDNNLAPSLETSTIIETSTIGIANPASTNCVEKGGNLVIEKKDDGSEYGLCYFDDARACEEWAMFRDDCPVGGVKTTGFDTIAQKFCAWSGGKTQAVEGAVCTFTDGSVCLADDFYAGTCQKGALID